MEQNYIWENKKLVRHSQEYYNWLLKVMEKRNLEQIWVNFSKTKSGLFTKTQILLRKGEMK